MACNLLAAKFIIKDDLKEAQERLKDMAYLIENTYGPEFITSNIHSVVKSKSRRSPPNRADGVDSVRLQLEADSVRSDLSRSGLMGPMGPIIPQSWPALRHSSGRLVRST